MGREIRRVPPNWEHPRTDEFGDNRYQPKYDEEYHKAALEWQAGCAAWANGDRGDVTIDCEFYWDWYGNPPDENYYLDYDPEALGDDAWYQLYETVSEGCPVSPPFATKQELIDYLASYGDFWDQQCGDGAWSRAAAEKFVNGDGWAPSMVVTDGKIIQARDGGFP